MIPDKLYDKGVKVRESAVGTLGPNQERLDLASPDTTPVISAEASDWSEKTLIYSVPEGKQYLMFFSIVSLTPEYSSNYADYVLLRRPSGGDGSTDVIAGRSSFQNARSITYPAGELFKSGEGIYLRFYNPYGSGTLSFNYFLHGILEYIK